MIYKNMDNRNIFRMLSVILFIYVFTIFSNGIPSNLHKYLSNLFIQFVMIIIVYGLYYYDTNDIKHELVNDLIDLTELELTNWNLTADENTIYSHQKVGINLTDPDKQLEVDGETRIRNNLYVDKSIYLGETNNARVVVDDDGNLYYYDINNVNQIGILNSVTEVPNDFYYPNICYKHVNKFI